MSDSWPDHSFHNYCGSSKLKPLVQNVKQQREFNAHHLILPPSKFSVKEKSSPNIKKIL